MASDRSCGGQAPRRAVPELLQACAVPEPFAWAGWARASCGSAVLVDQTAEYLSSADRAGQVDHLTRIVDERPLFPTLVWTVAVIMSFVASEHST